MVDQVVQEPIHELRGGARFPCTKSLGRGHNSLTFFRYFALLFPHITHFQIFRETLDEDGNQSAEVVASFQSKPSTERWKIRPGALGEDVPDDDDFEESAPVEA